MSRRIVFECTAYRVIMLFEKRHLPVERINDNHIRAILLCLTLEIAEKICAYAAVTLLFVDPQDIKFRSESRASSASDSSESFGLDRL